MKEVLLVLLFIAAMAVVAFFLLSLSEIDHDATDRSALDFEKNAGIQRLSGRKLAGVHSYNGVLSGRPVKYECGEDRCWWVQ